MKREKASKNLVFQHTHDIGEVERKDLPKTQGQRIYCLSGGAWGKYGRRLVGDGTLVATAGMLANRTGDFQVRDLHTSPLYGILHGESRL